ncbi:MAG: DEAD/DEAH box helicase, partial [Firmicutes bacterium]|nr:DEAD/DEAH box helicase [Bacillota bacterium]
LTREADRTPVTLTEERPLRVKNNNNPGAGHRGYLRGGSGKKGFGQGVGFKGKSRNSSRTF